MFDIELSISTSVFSSLNCELCGLTGLLGGKEGDREVDSSSSLNSLFESFAMTLWHIALLIDILFPFHTLSTAVIGRQLHV